MYSFVLLLFFQGVLSIKIISINVPNNVVISGKAYLSCEYDLEYDDELYSLKWYKKIGEIDHEFFSYVPNNKEVNNNNKSYPPGIDLDETKSSKTGHFLYLNNIDLDSEGWYKCEVSADNTFQTEKLSSYMSVLDPPKQPPEIKGELQTFYNVGDTVNISCLAPYSKPKSQLKWFINEEEASLNDVKEVNQGNELILFFTVRPNHFDKSKLLLKCVAYIQAMIQVSTQVSNEKILNGTNEPNNFPKIVGLKSNYSIGDIVDINCTMSNQSLFSRLDWYINDEKPNNYFVKKYQNNTSIGLTFRIKQHHLDDHNNVNIKCAFTKNISKEKVRKNF